MIDMITPTAIIVGMLNYYATLTPAVNQINLHELKCMADNVYFEARNQRGEGQRAVAHVTLNRVSDLNFPDTICGVVKQGKTWRGNPVKNRCQFSWYCDGKSDKVYLIHMHGKMRGQVNNKTFSSYTYAVAEALTAMIGWTTDPTKGAIYYYNHSLVTPKWAKRFRMMVRIQDHTFMRP